MDLIQMGGSLVAIIILSLVTAKLFPNSSRLTPERIIRNVKRYCPDAVFAEEDVQLFVSEDSMSGVLVFPDNCDGIAIATALGDRVVVRHEPRVDKLSIEVNPDSIVILTDDFTQPSVSLKMEEAAADHMMDSIMRLNTQNKGLAHA